MGMESINKYVFLFSLSPFLSVAELGALACVSHGTRILADDNDVWRTLYLAVRKKTFTIVPTSVHRWPRNWYICGGTHMSRTLWETSGRPCSRLSHYRHDTLQENDRKPVNYHNFKRAYAKHRLAQIGKFNEGSQRHLLRLTTERQACCQRYVWLQEEIGKCLKRRDAPAKFEAIMNQPPGTPPHLKRNRKRKRKRVCK